MISISLNQTKTSVNEPTLMQLFSINIVFNNSDHMRHYRQPNLLLNLQSDNMIVKNF